MSIRRTKRLIGTVARPPAPARGSHERAIGSRSGVPLEPPIERRRVGRPFARESCVRACVCQGPVALEVAVDDQLAVGVAREPASPWRKSFATGSSTQ